MRMGRRWKIIRDACGADVRVPLTLDERLDEMERDIQGTNDLHAFIEDPWLVSLYGEVVS